MWQWFLHFTGSDNTSGLWYGFWSGFGSDLAEFGLLGVVYQWYRKHTCHVDKCKRLGLLPVHGTVYHTCHRHHPNGGITHQHILDAHAQAQAVAPVMTDETPDPGASL